MSIELLIKHLNDYLPLDSQEIEELKARAKTRSIKRRQFILHDGDVCRHYNFVAQGCFKMYYVDTKGNEHNIQFGAENDWITDIGSFHSEKPSKLYIEAIEPSHIVQIEKSDLLFFYINYPKFNRTFRVIMEDKFVELQNRLLQNISFTAQEKYLNFLQYYSNLSTRLPNTQIASYLGITPEFLSKIRKNLA